MKQSACFLAFLILAALSANMGLADVITSGTPPSNAPTTPGSGVGQTPAAPPNAITAPGTVSPGSAGIPNNPGGSPGNAPAYTPPTGQAPGTNASSGGGVIAPGNGQ